MRTSAWAMVFAVVILTTGCATSEEWTTWKAHPVHFASGGHMAFSVRNREGRAPMVGRRDIVRASSEGWWGRPITVSQEQILER